MTSRRSALVTGATSGIGIAICQRLMGEGLFVYATARDRDKAIAALGESDRHAILITDLSGDDAPRSLIDSIPVEDDFQLIVNNAGGPLGEPDFQAGVPSDGESIFRLNVLAPYELSVLGAARMREGSIVNITSVNAHSTMIGANIPQYSSAKAALSHQTRLLARHLAPHVRVNAVAPGRTHTSAWGEPENAADIVGDALINRWVTSEEIADAVWFLHNNKACTGVELAVDGGIGLKPASTYV